MGMTIDKTIEFFNGLECHTPQAKDARDVAIETMRKYKELLDYIGGMNMCDEISNEAYKKIMIKFSE